MNLRIVKILILTFFSLYLVSCTKDQDFGKVPDAGSEIAKSTLTSTSGTGVNPTPTPTPTPSASPSPSPSPTPSGPPICGLGGTNCGCGDQGVVATLLYMSPSANVAAYSDNSRNYLSKHLGTNAASYPMVTQYPTNMRQSGCPASASPTGRILFTTDFVAGQSYGPFQVGCSGNTMGVVQVMQSTSQVFMNKVDVYDTNFENGLIYGPGPNDYIKDGTGAKLKEYFSLKIRGRIKLDSAHNVPGNNNFEFKLRSDDGAILWMSSNTTFGSPLINNDGYHAPTDSSISSPIALSTSSYVNFKIDYFQGPGAALAIQLLMRRVGSSNWEVVPASMLFMPAGETSPCP